MSLRRRYYLAEGGSYSLNVATVPLAKAREYAEKVFKSKGEKLDDALPDFDRNYLDLQAQTKKAPNIPRIDMPVIEPGDMQRFDQDLRSGRVDVFKPFAKGKLWVPKNLTQKTGGKWIGLGLKDGRSSDDVVKGQWRGVEASNLRPTQNQIWLEKLIKNIAKWGVPVPGSPVLSTTIIVSKEGFILDGHHRYGQVMLASPGLRLNALYIPIGIKRLLKVGRTYGNAIGNKQKA
jgi:hypothetical protein